jgi:protein TonB
VRWPFVVSLGVHAGAIVALCVLHERGGRLPHALPIACMRVDDRAEAPETCERSDAPEVPTADEPIDIEPFPEEAEEPEEIDFPGLDVAEAPPKPPPVVRPVRIPPLRRPAPREATAPPAPAPPAEAVRVTSPVPRGDRCRPPSYPAAARRAGAEGRVVLRVLVGRDGSVVSVEVEISSGSPLLDDAAIAAVREWTFQPAQGEGGAVEAVLRVPFRFRLRA